VITVAASLVLVLGLFLVVAWMLRKASPAGAAVLPKEVFELLGRAPLASRHQVHLVRCGRKLLLLSVSQAGIDSLAEIDDPVEVDRLAGLCAQAQPGSASMVFRQVFQQFTAGADSPTHANRGRELRHG
jgi:flagellar biogenesis protein FliO